MAKDATLSRRGKLFPRSYIRGNILDSSPKTNRISITVTRVRFEPGFPGRVRSGITTRLTEFLFELLRCASSVTFSMRDDHWSESKANLAEWLVPLLLSRGTRVQISTWSLRLRFDLSFQTNRGIYHGYSCGGTSSSGGSAWRRLP